MDNGSPSQSETVYRCFLPTWAALLQRPAPFQDRQSPCQLAMASRQTLRFEKLGIWTLFFSALVLVCAVISSVIYGAGQCQNLWNYQVWAFPVTWQQYMLIMYNNGAGWCFKMEVFMSSFKINKIAATYHQVSYETATYLSLFPVFLPLTRKLPVAPLSLVMGPGLSILHYKAYLESIALPFTKMPLIPF